jgi:C_GCAxxG_C_C family probable redox protein
MKRKDMLSETAVRHFKKGYNCSQSVLLTMFEHWNGKSALVPKIATGFGGGIGRCGSVCGALAGGVMALGIKYGSDEPSIEKREGVYELVRQLYKRFQSDNGSVLCRELIGYDLSNPAERKNAVQAGVFEKRCNTFIQNAIKILLDLTQDPV